MTIIKANSYRLLSTWVCDTVLYTLHINLMKYIIIPMLEEETGLARLRKLPKDAQLPRKELGSGPRSAYPSVGT